MKSRRRLRFGHHGGSSWQKTTRGMVAVPTAVISVVILLGAGASVGLAQSPLLDSFNPGANSEVAGLAVQVDGRILVGGYFTALNGQARNYLARLNADGTLDQGFYSEANSPVASLVVQTDGKILAAGSFTRSGGQPRNYLARLNADGTVDDGFNPDPNGYVASLVVQADGKILLGGGFTALGGQARYFIGRLNADGTPDLGFDPEANNEVLALAVQNDGKILVGGYFTTLAGQARSSMARLNADGTLDQAFNPGPNGPVDSLAVQADGRILLSGSFAQVSGQPRLSIARLNANGTLDAGFNPGANEYADSMTLQADGKIVLGGYFSTVGLQTVYGLARLNTDGTVDPAFSPLTDGGVNALAIQSDGKILASGYVVVGAFGTSFARFNNTVPATQSLANDGSTITWLRGGTSPEVWRTTFDYSTNGLTWSNLGAGSHIPGGWQLVSPALPPGGTIRARGHVTGGLANGSGWFVETMIGPPAISFQPSGSANLAGTTATFSVSAGGTEPLSYQWQKDGETLLEGGNVAGAMAPNLTISNVLKANEGAYRVVISNALGVVTSAVSSLTVIDPIIAAQPAASQFRNAGEEVTFSVTAVGSPPLHYQWWKDGVALAQGAGSLLTLTNLQGTDAGGYTVVVSNLYGSVTSAVAKLSVNVATLDGGFNAANGGVYAFAVQADGKILLGGYFGSLVGQPRRTIGRFNADGTLDPGFNPGANAGVYALAVQPDGKILVGGTFTVLGQQRRVGMARLNVDGTVDLDFNPGTNGPIYPGTVTVYAIAVQPDGKILAGGYFTSWAGQTRNYLARLNTDGTLDSAFNPGADYYVTSLAVQADGKILVGGDFSMLAGQMRRHLARLNSDGTLDVGFDPGTDTYGYVNLLAVQPDGKILVGGDFNMLGGQTRHHLARLNGDGTLDLGFDPDLDSSVSSMVVQADGNILVGGSFGSVGGQMRHYLARLNGDGTLDLGFSPEPDSTVISLAVQADGRILLGGFFGSVAGQPRTYLARLTTPDPATQTMANDGSTVTWLRGGSSPEVWRTTFDYSTNGRTWTRLGDGSHLAAGWQLGGLALPPGGTTRARGYVTGGLNNGSGWFVETMIGPPAISFQPDSTTNTLGAIASFNVGAGGTEPLAYHWRKDGVALADGASLVGTRTAALIVSNLLISDQGGYSVVVSNAEGSVTSTVARLTVILPDPLDQWQVTYAVAPNLRSIIYAVGRYLAVGNSGLMLASSDAVSWTSFDSGTDQNLHGITYGGGTYVAVGGAGTILSSTDALNWTNQPSGTSVRLFGVAYAAGLFVAVGDNGTIVTSADGQNWAGQSSGTVNHLHAIAYGNGLFVAVGRGGTILSSAEGVIWTGRNSGTNAFLEGITYAADTFVAVGDLGTILISADGVSWTSRDSLTTENLNGVAYGDGILVAIGDGTVADGTIVTSRDGVIWTSRQSGTGKNLRGVTYAGGAFVAVGNDGAILRSSSLAPARLAVRSRPNQDGFELTVAGEIGRSYRVQASSDLRTWTDLFSFSNSEQETVFLDSDARKFSHRFYRVVSP